MTNAVGTIKTAVAKTRAMQTKSQVAQKTQVGGPTISGVQGIGKQSTVKRPMSAQSTKAPHSQHTGLSGQFGEGKESEATANQLLGQTNRMKIIKAHYKPKPIGGGNDYFSHMANKTAKTTVKEDAPAMSIGSGQVAPIAPPDATANYALQQKNKQRYKQMMRRKAVKVK